MRLNLRVRLCLLVQLRLGDALRRKRAPVLAHVALEPRARALLPLAPVEQVVEPQAAPRCLRRVHRAHALQRGAVGRIPGANQVEQLVVRADEVDVPDEEPLLVAHSGAHQLRHLPLHERDRVHHALWPDHVYLAGREEARRAKVKVILVSGLAKDGVPGILARVDARDDLHLGVPRDRVDRLALALVPKVGAGDEDDGRFGDERVQHLLNRSLLVLGRRHVVQLGQPRQVLQQGVDLPPLVGELLVVTHAKLALSCAARRARAGRAGRFAHAELLLVAVLVLLVVRERRASGSRSGEKAAAPQPPGLLLEPLIERDDQSEPESTERRAGGEVEESAHGAGPTAPRFQGLQL
mmetsp:Transcript_36621/g.121280  ORF Transcript_36621/g.121280 Transcript_36621/m.121280 type:complete len:352 (-) Transcript_36621:8-1063(-)